MEGLELGSFVLKDPLASGGMGTVWRAVHRSGVAAAVKIIAADVADGLDAAATLQAEIRAVGALDHPNIVRVYDAGTLEPHHAARSGGRLAAGSPWLAMELADGAAHDLEPTLDWSSLASLLLQVLDGLAHAHARGVIHRDLKPGNLLYSGSRILVADFGLAWRWRGAELLHGGSLPYAAPEQFLGLRTEQGPWTDLYALGCAAFRLASGVRPFPGNDPEVVRQGHLFAPIPTPVARFPVPRGFGEWLAGLMAKDPRDRFQCAADAAWALVQLPAPGEESEGDSPTAPTVRTRPARGSQTITLPLAQWVKLQGAAVPLMASRVRPPVPADWARPREARPAALGGRGLGLFGLREPPLIGRQAERDLLWSILSELDRPRIVVLRGGEGVGKSRLASWFVERAHEVGAADVFRGSFDRVPGEVDGLPGLLEEHLHTQGMETTELLRHLRYRLQGEVPEREAWNLARLLRPADPQLGGEPVGGAHRLAAVWRVIARRAESRRVVIWLDDAHHSVEPVALIEHVAGLPEPPSVLFVLTAGTGSSPAESRLRAMVAALDGADLTLLPLGRGELTTLIQRMLPVGGDVATRIATHANGSPLVAVQLVAHLVERGALQGDPGGMWLAPGDVLPASLATLWNEALGRLSEVEGAREALRVAAVLGRTFSHSEWRDASARLGITVTPALLGAVVNRGLVVPDRVGGRYSFAHGMLRDVLVDEGKTRGEAIDLACAEVLATRGEPFAARAGLHFEEAGALSEAVTAYLVALRWLSEWDRERALEMSSRWYSALGRIAGDSDPRWVQGMQVLVDLYATHGGQAHRKAVEELLERGRATGDRVAEIRALIELARLDLRAGAIDRAEARAEVALRRARGTTLALLATVTRAEVRRAHGDLRGAEATLRSLLPVPSDRGADQAVVLALARVTCDAGRPTEGLLLLSEWADRQTRAQPPMTRARLQRGRGHALGALGRTTEAVAALEEADRMRQRAGFDWPVLELDLGCALAADGKLDRARVVLRRTLELLDAGGDARHRANGLAALALVECRAGDAVAVEGLLDALEPLPVRGHRRATIDLLRQVVRWAEGRGRADLAHRARQWAERAGLRDLGVDGRARAE